MSRDEEYLAAGMGWLIAVVILTTAWLVVKAIELIARVMIAHPENRLLWGLLFSTLFFLALSSVASFQIPVLDTLTSISFSLLLLVAKIAEVYYSQLMQPQISREVVFDQVLHQPWFQAA